MWLAIQALLQALPKSLFNYSVLLAVMAVVFAVAERKYPLHPGKVPRKTWLLDLTYFYLAMVITSLVLLLVVNLTAWALNALGPMPWHAWVAQLSRPLAFVASVLVTEIAYYGVHRIAHEVPFFWRFHAVHHSSPQLYWLCASRTHPLDLSFFRAVVFVCLYVVGFGHGGAESRAVSLPGYALWMTVWSYLMHANIRLRLGWLEYVVASPAFHHWHHVKGDPALVDKNYAANFPFMDLLFGTFYLPKKEWPKQYGIDDVLAPSMWGQLIDPLRGRKVRQIGLTAWNREPLKQQPQR
jgi:sterol desaturase/sphingolipid hydroxylase (fatty acid hydroxylase superfamily)